MTGDSFNARFNAIVQKFDWLPIDKTVKNIIPASNKSWDMERIQNIKITKIATKFPGRFKTDFGFNPGWDFSSDRQFFQPR